MTEIESVPVTEAVIVRPGETVIVSLGDRLISREQADLYRNRLKQQLPNVEFVLVNAEQMLVYRPQADT